MDDEIYLKLKIMDEEFFSRGAFVGQTTYRKFNCLENNFLKFCVILHHEEKMIIPSETTKLFVLLSHPILHTTCSDLLIIRANLLFF